MMNCTIIERIKCMLKTTRLSKAFWGEATQTAWYLINRSPLGPLNFEVPEKEWTEKYVSYSHLRVFGCKCFVHVPKEQRSKLDDKAVPHVFIGYGDEKFGFRLWDLTKKKLVRSKDVVFQDDQTLGDFNKANQSKGTSDDFIELIPILLSLELEFIGSIHAKIKLGLCGSPTSMIFSFTITQVKCRLGIY